MLYGDLTNVNVLLDRRDGRPPLHCLVILLSILPHIIRNVRNAYLFTKGMLQIQIAKRFFNHNAYCAVNSAHRFLTHNKDHVPRYTWFTKTISKQLKCIFFNIVLQENYQGTSITLTSLRQSLHTDSTKILSLCIDALAIPVTTPAYLVQCGDFVGFPL